MPHRIPGRHQLRIALALLILAILTSLMPIASKAAPPSAPRAIGPTAQTNEIEPNNTVATATLLPLTPATSPRSATAFGTIDTNNDAAGAQGDWYKFATLGGTIATISLSNLPAD